MTLDTKDYKNILFGFGTILAVMGITMFMFRGKEEKAAPSGTVDSFQQHTFDERTLPFAGIVVDNMMARPRTNILLNELYGGVPPVTITDMTSYITGEWP